MKKNILVVDDSALMRRVMCDIINSDGRFEVKDIARDGMDALELIKSKSYDAVVLDINMPRMTGLELLEALQEANIRVNVIMASTLTVGGAKETMQALELGAVDFVTKPGNFIEARGLDFRQTLLRVLEGVLDAHKVTIQSYGTGGLRRESSFSARKEVSAGRSMGQKLVALACSTGGPKSLQSVLPHLPKNLDAPILLVQHMPAGFTATLAGRLNELSEIQVKEAQDGEEIVKGCAYIAPGGKHLKCVRSGSGHRISISDEPPRDALKPCANIMYESLLESHYDEITCVVLTGMGSDGTKGIRQLATKKQLYVIAQDAPSSVVYGMPKSVTEAGLADKVASLDAVADEITRNVGVY